MSSIALDRFFQQFADEQMNFLYTGEFSDEHTDGFIQLNNHQYNAADEFKTLQRRAGFLIAECFQNIVRHNDREHSDSFFQIENNNGIFNIVSGNRVSNDIIPDLKSQLEQLNQLTSQELKDAYRSILMNGEYSDKGGAGLGLIEMARRSKNKLSFQFSEIDENTSYFYFRLRLNAKNAEELPINHNFDNSISLREQMLQEQLFFVYKGVVSIQTTIVILGIIEGSLKSVNQKVLFVKYMGLFEKLASLDLDGLIAQNPVLTIGEKENKYQVNCSFYLNTKESLRIERMVKMYNFYDSKSLDEAYKQSLNEGQSHLQQNFTTDIIELLKNCSHFDFDRTSLNDTTDQVKMSMAFIKKNKHINRFDLNEVKLSQEQGAS